MPATTVNADALDLSIESQIHQARTALVEFVRARKGSFVSARELKVQARGTLPSGVMGLAVRSLIADGIFEQRERDLLVRLPPESC
jgi:hypothetical protein